MIRFLAALLVVVSHAPVLMGTGVDLCYRFTGGESSFGGVAVAVFFFLSGLFVTNSLQHSRACGDFLRKRCRRIFPQIWVVTLFVTFIFGPMLAIGGGMALPKYLTSPKTWQYLANLFLIPAHDLPGVFTGNPIRTVNGALWTMPVEFACYLSLVVLSYIASFIDGNGKMEKIFHILCFCGIIGLIALSVMLLPEHETVCSILRPVGLFFVGSICCDWKERIKVRPWYGIVALLLLLLTAPLGMFSFGLLFLLPCVIVNMVISAKQVPLRLKLWDISYEMYLVAYPIQQTLICVSGNRMSLSTHIVLTVAIDLVIAWLLSRITESMLGIWDNSLKRP